MAVLVIGGTGFIGYRLVRLLVARGETVTSMDVNPAAHSFADLGAKVRSVRGDIAQFDEVMTAMAEAGAERVVNLAFLIGSGHPPHAALKLNVLGLDNCLEAARLLNVKHVVYAGSFAVNGRQSNYGDRAVAEDDPVHGEYLYARHKIMNEWQARDYIEEYGMQVTGIRAAYVTGSDKVRGTLDHVKIITEPALGNAVTIPYEDAMCCAIHVDDMAEVFARVVLKDKPAHRIYNSGGTAISHGEIAAIVRSCIPDARILFQSRTGAKAVNATYLLDNSRLRTEFAIEFPPFRERVQQIINEVRQKHGLSAVG